MNHSTGKVKRHMAKSQKIFEIFKNIYNRIIYKIDSIYNKFYKFTRK